MKRMMQIAVVATWAWASVTSIATADGVQIITPNAVIAASGYHGNAGFGSFWMSSGDKLARVSLRDNSTTISSVRLGFRGNVVVGDGAVWSSDNLTTIDKINPQNAKIVDTIHVELTNGVAEWGLAVGEGAVWVISGADAKTLRRYSSASCAELAVIPLPARSSAVLVAFGSIWISGTGNDELYRIDPATNQIVATIEMRNRPRALTAGEGSVWVMNEGDGTVQRVDGRSGKVVATVETGTVGKNDITAGGGSVWLVTRQALIVQIDPRANSVRGRYAAETNRSQSEFFGIGYGGDSLWLSGSSLMRIAAPP
jgi:streptogramin lyase